VRMTEPSRLCVTAFLLVWTFPALAGNWPGWRGPGGDGRTTETDLPVHWGRTENVRWCVPMPEPGNSTPIVWNNRILVTQALEKEDRRTVMCLDRSDGRRVWQEGVTYRKKDKTHSTNPYCSASPVTDGERIIAWFGSAGVVCYDFQGKELWRRDLGIQDHIWGTGSSPILDGDLCILNFGPGNREFLVALDKRTGKTVWKVQVPEGSVDSPESRSGLLRGSWTTPLVIRVGGQAQLIMHWPKQVVAYDPRTGEELWSCQGLADLAYTSPIFGDDILVALGGYNGPSLAVRPGGSGDITETHRIWRKRRSDLFLGTGVVVDGRLYVNDMHNNVHCVDVFTGKEIWKERLRGKGGAGESWSSLMLSEDNLYMLNQAGDAFVFKASPEFQLVATNSLYEKTNSSVVPSNGELYIRTVDSLWCISEKEKSRKPLGSP
jgi:outer membrane protein assembly factor BamB